MNNKKLNSKEGTEVKADAVQINEPVKMPEVPNIQMPQMPVLPQLKNPVMHFQGG